MKCSSCSCAPHQTCPFPTSYSIISPRQIHSSEVHVVSDSQSVYIGDGLVTRLPHTVLKIHTADCVPLILIENEHTCIAVVHVGWKGLANGIVHTAIHTMKEIGAQKKSIECRCGPYIGSCCYSIPRERADSFSTLFPKHIDTIIQRKEGAYMLDLGACIRIQLIQCGLEIDNISLDAECTYCSTKKYPSYRRDSSFPQGQIATYAWIA